MTLSHLIATRLKEFLDLDDTIIGVYSIECEGSTFLSTYLLTGVVVFKMTAYKAGRLLKYHEHHRLFPYQIFCLYFVLIVGYIFVLSVFTIFIHPVIFAFILPFICRSSTLSDVGFRFDPIESHSSICVSLQPLYPFYGAVLWLYIIDVYSHDPVLSAAGSSTPVTVELRTREHKRGNSSRRPTTIATTKPTSTSKASTSKASTSKSGTTDSSSTISSTLNSSSAETVKPTSVTSSASVSSTSSSSKPDTYKVPYPTAAVNICDVLIQCESDYDLVSSDDADTNLTVRSLKRQNGGNFKVTLSEPVSNRGYLDIHRHLEKRGGSRTYDATVNRKKKLQIKSLPYIENPKFFVIAKNSKIIFDFKSKRADDYEVAIVDPKQSQGFVVEHIIELQSVKMFLEKLMGGGEVENKYTIANHIDAQWFQNEWNKKLDDKKVDQRKKFDAKLPAQESINDLFFQALGSNQNIDDFVMLESQINEMKKRLWMGKGK
ncbi:unnamed protein product [Periconia digitata]|uniref:Uncharacterized protein n=1 Tax=Periconia digitata TaxID=1303443 RepID=A0A9W4U5C0_9PLEO|nr:unnamed protein product [Periconia digitata]